MKKLLFVLSLLWFNLSAAQVVTLMYVEVSNENQQRFERLEKDLTKTSYQIQSKEEHIEQIYLTSCIG